MKKMNILSSKRSLIASGLMLITLLVINHFGHFKNINPLQPLSGFPRHIGHWYGETGRFDQKIYDILGVDDFFLCNYKSHDGKQIQLYIGYYNSQREGVLIHSPKNCMPGSGWNIIHTSIKELTVPGIRFTKTNIIKMILKKGNQKQVLLYWFQSRGRIICSEYRQKIYLVLDAILKHRTDGSFVRLIAPVSQNEAKTTEYMEVFIQQLFPILEQYLPGA